MAALHEDLRREHAVTGSSDRSFGLVMAIACAIAGLAPLVRGRAPMRTWLVVVAGVLFLLALLAPSTLTHLNRLWMKLGLLLGMVTTPIVLFVFYAFILTPMALAMRIAGKDPLRLRRSNAPTYWIARTPPGPSPKSLSRQF